MQARAQTNFARKRLGWQIALAPADAHCVASSVQGDALSEHEPGRRVSDGESSLAVPQEGQAVRHSYPGINSRFEQVPTCRSRGWPRAGPANRWPAFTSALTASTGIRPSYRDWRGNSTQIARFGGVKTFHRTGNGINSCLQATVGGIRGASTVLEVGVRHFSPTSTGQQAATSNGLSHPPHPMVGRARTLKRSAHMMCELERRAPNRPVPVGRLSCAMKYLVPLLFCF